MKKQFLISLLTGIFLATSTAYATDSTNQNSGSAAPSSSSTSSPDSAATAEPYKALNWEQLLQQKYQVTAEQLKALDDAKLTDSQKAMLLQLSKASGKTVEEVLAAREGGKKGWGSLAKQFGVEEKSLGQAVSEMMHLRNEERKKERESKKQIEKQKRDSERKLREEKREAEKKARKEKLEADRKERDEKREADKKAREEKLAAEKAEREKRREEDKKLREEMKKDRERKHEERKEKQREKHEEKNGGKGKADK